MKNKNIFMLFMAMYLSNCISPLFLGRLPVSGAKLTYIALILPCFSIVFFGELALSKLCGGSWIEIYEKEKTEQRERICGMDIVRFFAVVFVPAIHFMGLTGYYNTPLEGKLMLVATYVRWLFICCVPLFLTITGYFKHKKTFDSSHYKSIFAVLMTHIFISTVRLVVDYKIHSVEITKGYILKKLVYFEYGWYVKLYIGIMLLVPFANIIWNSLKERKYREYLILTLILLCSMGPLTFEIIPTSWVMLYVFIYYFIGAYLCEYKVVINKLLNIFLLMLFVGLTTFGSFLNTTENGLFNWDFSAYGSNSGYSAFPVVIITTLIMLLLSDLDIKFKPVRGFLYSVSVVSLEIYMFSQMFDGIVYPELGFETFNEAFPSIILVVGGILVLSYSAAHIKRLIFAIAKFLLCVLHNTKGE